MKKPREDKIEMYKLIQVYCSCIPKPKGCYIGGLRCAKYYPALRKCEAIQAYYLSKIPKKKDICYSEVTRLSVNELIPFEQVEPFKRLARLLDHKVNEAVADFHRAIKDTPVPH